MGSNRSSQREIFAVLEGFSKRFSELVRGLAAITEAALDGPLLAGADLLFRAETDVALLRLRFDSRSSEPKLAWVSQKLEAAHLPILDPLRLTDADKDKFYSHYLASYRVRVEGLASPQDALEELARMLELDDAPPRRRPEAAGSYSLHRGSGRKHPGLKPTSTASHRLRMGAARGKQKATRRKPTVPGTPRARSEERARDKTPAQSPIARAQSPSLAELMGSPSIEVRFLRGDDWLPARLRALNMKGATFATSAPPRNGDTVHVAIRYGHDLALVRSEVVESTGAHGPLDPHAIGFRVNFVGVSGDMRDQLVAILTRAQNESLSLTPPPPRHSARFPVRWPIQLTSSHTRLRASALDVSLGGLFIATPEQLRERDLHFQLALDRGGAIAGQARLARQVSDQMASSRGLERGYGVEITRLSEVDRACYADFLERVRRRSERRILVAASPARAELLSGGLSAAGYAVTTSSDVNMLAKLASLEPRPPDAAVIDASLESELLLTAFGDRNVPLIRTRREDAHRTRAVVDQVLKVAA